MDRESIYYRQVQLLLQLLPFIAKHDCFALKGGTAINLFIRNFPRLSVDIDLVYLPVLDREESLKGIKAALDDIAKSVLAYIPQSKVSKSYEDKNDALRLVVIRDGVLIKIELSPVLRGTVFEPALLQVCEAVEDELGFAEISVVSFADLYAGKICAALDRQHPRDLFDVKLLLDNEGLTSALRKALLVYLISHPRPIAELLQPHLKDISGIYEGEFRNMADVDVPLAELLAVRRQLIDLINGKITQEEKEFLLSFKNKEPDWTLLGLDNIDKLPAVRWKRKNLSKMPAEKHANALKRLSFVLDVVM
ncbi:nucleotidyl transferase AbiEii/AbiGii toxin family protein [Rahnella variigena]|jgi:predicted nucleotidyltransferase component of viral defense system|uniref:nucleotidyl transferase AbiEii/AbiGii toxin family protein n=1 Tax=Rahnella variigena TaxID=574964 RepID=UPI00101D4024|nr:nucleotidyl transferase AbiEii/AbiGii toxin family protein [Rahnella variigena]RYJ11878.1 nucleotidyl transferase AbiEii/AbiGii toxin family protein [Rahnella variigena]